MFGPSELVNGKGQQSLFHPKQPDTVRVLSGSVVLYSTPKFQVRDPKKFDNFRIAITDMIAERSLDFCVCLFFWFFFYKKTFTCLICLKGP